MERFKFSFFYVIIYFLFWSGFLFAQNQNSNVGRNSSLQGQNLSLNNQIMSQGETLFKENNPSDAVKVLENEILNGIVSANTYNFLGLGYYQLGEYGKSIDAFERGIKNQPTLTALLSFNQGNTYYAMKDFTSAIRCYSQVLKEDPNHYEAYLNRANALLMASQLKNAKEEYISYLQKRPDDKQRVQIEAIINALSKEILRREEEERLLAEMDKAKWEQIDGLIENSIAENKNEENGEQKSDWEEVTANIPEEKEEITQTTEYKSDWEQVATKIPEEKKEVEKTPDWEKVLNENEIPLPSDEKTNSELVMEDNDLTDWQTLTGEEEDELRMLDEKSRKERELWLAEQKRIIKEREKDIKRKENDEKVNNILAKEKEEQELRQKIMEEMMKAENERKQKLLEDLTYSLMNAESTNMSSGADDILDYDLEGELD